MVSDTPSVRVRAWEKKMIEDRGITVSDVFHYGARCIKEGVAQRGGCTENNIVISGEPPAPRTASSQTAIDAAAAAPRRIDQDKTTMTGTGRSGIPARAEDVSQPAGDRRIIYIERIE